MTTIDFKRFSLWRDLGEAEPAVLDVRREAANYLLSNVGGVEGMDLALRIYRSDEAVELTDEQFATIRAAMARPLERGGVVAAMYYSLLRNAGEVPGGETQEA